VSISTDLSPIYAAALSRAAFASCRVREECAGEQAEKPPTQTHLFSFEVPKSALERFTAAIRQRQNDHRASRKNADVVAIASPMPNLMLTPEQQAAFVEELPECSCRSLAGGAAWGKAHRPGESERGRPPWRPGGGLAPAHGSEHAHPEPAREEETVADRSKQVRDAAAVPAAVVLPRLLHRLHPRAEGRGLPASLLTPGDAPRDTIATAPYRDRTVLTVETP
jgi:hypothetical protein